VSLKQKIKQYLQKRQRELLKEEDNVAIRIGKYDMASEVLAVLDGENLTIAEEEDVKVSLKEIKKARLKKFKNVDSFLEELKEKDGDAIK
jgi:hypothetical protein